MRKKILICSFSFLVLTLAGCLKDTPSTDLSHEGTIIEMIYPAGASNNGVGTGLEFFAGCTVLFPPTDASDTITFYVNIAGTNTLKTPLNYTVAIDDSALQDNVANDGLTYAPMPDSLYSILKTKGTIAAGSRMDTLQIVFYPSKIDLTQTYGLPIKLYVPGYTIASNFGIMYLHTIGNPIAGVYNQEWIRYNTATQTGTPAYDEQIGPSVFAPIDGTDITVNSGTGVTYDISFTDSANTETNFQVSLDAASVKTAGITITSGPTIILASPSTHQYTFNFTYTNSAGSPRNITDKFY
jgi:hypothetical protein